MRERAAAKESARIGLLCPDAHLYYVALYDIKGQQSVTANGSALPRINVKWTRNSANT